MPDMSSNSPVTSYWTPIFSEYLFEMRQSRNDALLKKTNDILLAIFSSRSDDAGIDRSLGP